MSRLAGSFWFSPRLLLTLTLALCVWPTVSQALVIDGNQVIVDYGGKQEPHARVVFNKNRAARRGVIVETFRAGVAGSKLTVLVDNKVLLSHTFDAADCSHQNGAEHCMIAINGRDHMLAKQLSFLAWASAAGIVLGAKVPIILMSRADSAATHLASCALGVLLARATTAR